MSGVTYSHCTDCSVNRGVITHYKYHTDARNENGHSLLDVAMECYDLDVNMVLYLINHGCDSDEEKVNLLYRACTKGGLKVVKELVEQHNVNPKGELMSCMHATTPYCIG